MAHNEIFTRKTSQGISSSRQCRERSTTRRQSWWCGHCSRLLIIKTRERREIERERERKRLPVTWHIGDMGEYQAARSQEQITAILSSQTRNQQNICLFPTTSPDQPSADKMFKLNKVCSAWGSRLFPSTSNLAGTATVATVVHYQLTSL